MAKKKKSNLELDTDYQDDFDSSVVEPNLDEDEETDEPDEKDEFDEDESDLAMIRNLENEDRRTALSYQSFEEEVGFNPEFDWSSVPEATQSKFVALMDEAPENIAQISWKRLPPLQKWIVARACMKNGMHEMFREIAQSIVKSRKSASELCIEDIHLEIVRDYVETHEYQEALQQLDKFEQVFPKEYEVALRVRAIIYFAMGDKDKGKELIDMLIDVPFNRGIPEFEQDHSCRDNDERESRIMYEVGYALMNLKIYELARYYFERSRNRASLNDDYELTMAIDNALAHMGENESE